MKAYPPIEVSQGAFKGSLINSMGLTTPLLCQVFAKNKNATSQASRDALSSLVAVKS
jgi:hypothetical protein